MIWQPWEKEQTFEDVKTGQVEVVIRSNAFRKAGTK
jgi:hypothetical protein